MRSHAFTNLPFVERFYSHPVVSSTNDLARSLTEFPHTGIFVIQADHQTAGRGRSGAPYFSGNGGLWTTILTPLTSMDEHFSHNRALSLAIAGATEVVVHQSAPVTSASFTSSIAIKWPNDILLNGKKLCGILLENHPARSNMLVMGFGLNVNIAAAAFPDAVRPLAVSLSMATGKTISRSSLLEGILCDYRANLAIDASQLHAKYLKRLYRRGDIAEVEGRRGIVDGVSLDGKLRLLVGGEVRYLVSGHCRFIDSPERLPDA